MYKIYKAEFPNSEYYIGLTKSKLKKRISEHSHRSIGGKHNKIPFYRNAFIFGFESISWSIESEFDNLIDAENEEKRLISIGSEKCLNVLSGGISTDNTNLELRKRVSEGLKGHIVKESTKEKLREIAKKQFSSKESREHQRQMALKQFQDPIKRQNYLDAMSRVDKQAQGIKKSETDRKKRELRFEILKKLYKPTMTMADLSRVSKIPYVFITKYRLEWSNFKL